MREETREKDSQLKLIERLEADPEFLRLSRELQIDGSWAMMQLLAKDASSGGGDGGGSASGGGSSGSSSGDSCGTGGCSP